MTERKYADILLEPGNQGSLIGRLKKNNNNSIQGTFNVAIKRFAHLSEIIIKWRALGFMGPKVMLSPLVTMRTA